MAFYRDFTVEDSYVRVNKSLKSVKVSERLNNVQSYQGRTWYEMPNARGTETSTTFPSFFRDKQINHEYVSRPSTGPKSAPDKSEELLRLKDPMDLRRHGALTPIDPAEFERENGEDKKETVQTLSREEADNVKKTKYPNNSMLAKKFRKNAFQAASRVPLILADYEGNNMVPRGMFEKSELRENLLKLQDIAFDGFRERIQKKWPVFKTQFLASHLRGLSLWRDFSAMVINSDCGVTHAQLESMLKALPQRFQNKKARLRYFEFVEYSRFKIRMVSKALV